MSTQEHVVAPPGGTYLLTEDLPDKIERFRHLGINTPGYHSSLYGELQDRLADALQSTLPSDQAVYRVKMHKLATQIAGFIDSGEHEWAGEDVLVVSTCPELAYPERGMSIQANRLVDLNGEYFSLVEKNGEEKWLPVGPRPGQPSLRHQIEKVVEGARGRRIVIAEDGIFTGDTLLTLIGVLRDSGADVAGIVTGFRFQIGSNAAIDEAVPVHVVHPEIADLIEWVPDHDFLPFTPGCGKVLGCVVGQNVFPFSDYTGATFSVPYIEPFGRVASWASIPEDNAEKFSRQCLTIAKDLYEELDRLNPDREPLRISDVMLAPHQRVSIPVSVTSSSKELPVPSLGVAEFLDGHLA